MSSNEILAALSELEGLVASRRREAIFGSGEVVWTMTSITGSVVRNDWRPVWEKSREIQSMFNAKPRFASREERDAAWQRFNELRDEAGQTSKEEFAQVQNMSDYYRGDLMSDLRKLEYDPTEFNVLDDILGKATAEDMKRLGSELSAVSRRFSEWKDKLTREHKQEIFEKIQDVRAMHQKFWSQRNEAWERTQEQRSAKRSEFEARVRQNIADNREKLAKAENAAERCRANISSNREKLADARSEEYAARVRGWISDHENRLDDIQSSIRRIRGWIEEDEAKLR